MMPSLIDSDRSFEAVGQGDDSEATANDVEALRGENQGNDRREGEANDNNSCYSTSDEYSSYSSSDNGTNNSDSSDEVDVEDNVNIDVDNDPDNEWIMTEGATNHDARSGQTCQIHGNAEEIVVITMQQPMPKVMTGVNGDKRRQPFNRIPGNRSGRNFSDRYQSSSKKDFSRVRMIIGQEEITMVPLKKLRPTFRAPLRQVDLFKSKQLRAGVIAYIEVPGPVRPQLYFCLGLDQRTGDITDFGGGVTKKDSTALHAALREFHEETLGIFIDHVPSDKDFVIVTESSSPPRTGNGTELPAIMASVGVYPSGSASLPSVAPVSLPASVPPVTSSLTVGVCPSGSGLGAASPNAAVINRIYDRIGDSLAIFSERSFVVFIKIVLPPGIVPSSRVMRCFVDRFQRAKELVTDPEISNIVWVTRPDLEAMIGRRNVGDHRMYDRIRMLLHGGDLFYDLL
jgi:hypothetical protein